tara:strand:+ start:3759 stop:4139 length:381 start_codon:yes stop_codon:yes gene_type:complete
MYKLTDAKRAINSINHIIKEANNYVVDLTKNSILDQIELDNKQKEQLEQVFFNIKDQISENNLLTTIQDKKKRKKINRVPSEYNLFIKDNIASVRENNPELNNKEVLSKVAMLWNKQKMERLKLKD